MHSLCVHVYNVHASLLNTLELFSYIRLVDMIGSRVVCSVSKVSEWGNSLHTVMGKY
jgi:hypothetical protein